MIGKAAEKHRSRSRYSVNEAPIVRSRKEIQKSLESSRRSRSSLDAYLTSITAHDIIIPRLEATLDGYTRLCEKLDKQILDLEEKLEDITNELRDARGLDSNDQATPSWNITISLYCKIAERVKLSITYGTFYLSALRILVEECLDKLYAPRIGHHATMFESIHKTKNTLLR